jgi:Protein of unknown function (DUF1566)
MKIRIIKLLAILIITLTYQAISTSSFAQAPQKMSYQAVIRDAGNKLVTNHTVGIKISILKIINIGVPIRTIFYTETQSPTTNADGLISIEIGGGTGFDIINWANGPYYIETDIDPTGGTNYTISGTTQLLSVPYALNAKTANCHYVGEHYGGGIVFYVYDNGQHGLIADSVDLSTGIQWNNGTNKATGATGDGVGAGAMNTAMIIATQMADNQSGNFAAKVCADYSSTVNDVTYGGWYLPSKNELALLYMQRKVIGGFANATYWSSNEGSSSFGWIIYFGIGALDGDSKDAKDYVRAIRAF